MISIFFLLTIAVNGGLSNLLPEPTRTSSPFWITLLPLAIGVMICAFAVLPVLVEILLRTSFHGLRVRLIRD